MQTLCRSLKKEVKQMLRLSTNSMLLHSASNNLECFSWEKFEKELQMNTPKLYDVMMALTSTRSSRSNRSAVMCMCAAIIFKFRYAKMSLIHKLISCVLYAGHTSKQV
jgi:hypothetical protein